MVKLAILKFSGALESGFQVNLEIAPEGKPVERGFKGDLPAAPELKHSLVKWQKNYQQLGSNWRIKPKKIIYDGSLSLHQKLIHSAQELEQKFANWLNLPGFSSVDKRLREALNREDKIRMLICSDRPELDQLPWCCWDLVDSYPLLEIALSNFDFERVPQTRPSSHYGQVRVLAILGDSQGIDLEADRVFLNSLTAAQVVFLVEPTPEKLYQYLWQETWDIVFFAGHSQTISRQGILALNPQDNLTIEQLKHGFRQAISSGLQLAIFNSCDGLGLAEELGKLSLPSSIVMRLPVPDSVAQQFLKYFLQAYAKSDQLYIAVRQAREQLQGYEHRFPCASWLPTIYQNPAVIPPTWNSLCGTPETQSELASTSPDAAKKTSFDAPLAKPHQEQSSSIPADSRQFNSVKLNSVIWAAVIATVLVWLIQSWGWLEAAELKSYDRFVAWRQTLPADQRVLVITIDDHDISYQRHQGMGKNMRGSLSDITLNQLLVKLKSSPPRAIASDIIHDFDFDPALAQTLKHTDNFFAICRIKVNRAKLATVAPPAQLSRQNLGFSNWALDNDGAIRRQILGMASEDVCNTDQSLSLRLAVKYLSDRKNISVRQNSAGILQIGQVNFPKLNATAGGYHLPEALGYQVLLNYGRALPQTIPLREILTLPKSSLGRLTKDKIIFLGVLGNNHDLHYTPISKGKQAQKQPGVIIHAQMTSHLIDVILGEQKLLWWVDDRLELVWIAVWSILGSLVVFPGKHSFVKTSLGILGALTLMLGCCWLLFLNGGWLIAIAPGLALLLAATIKSIQS